MVLGPFTPNDINNNLQVVGEQGWMFDDFAYWDSVNGYEGHGDLVDRNYTYGEAINNVGYSVGRSSNRMSTGDHNLYAALSWTQTSGLVNFADIIGFTGWSSGAYDVNDSSQVVGYLRDKHYSSTTYAFRYSPGDGIDDLSYFSGGVRANASVAYGINNFGSVVGNARVDTEYLPFRNDGSYSYFLGSNIVSGKACAINDHGVVVGQAEGETNSFAFIYDSAGFRDLNTLREIEFTIVPSK